MANYSSDPSPCYKPFHVRSISLPSRSHPLSARVEEGLLKLKTWVTSSLLQAPSPSAEALRIALESLEEMYCCMEELLQLPHNQQALARHWGSEEWVAEEMDSSVRLLDICGTSRDAISSMKEQAQELQCSLRTRRPCGEFYAVAAKTQIRSFIRSRKNMVHKDSSKCLKSLKLLEEKRPIYPLPAADCDQSLTLTALKDLRAITILVFRAISSFLSKPAASASMAKWLPTSWTCKSSVLKTSELDKVDALLLRSIHGKVSKKDVSHETVQEAQRQLQRLEDGMGSVEAGLESLFRRLIQNRVSLLNIFSP